MKEIIIDPRFSYYYASFYLYGLHKVYTQFKFSTHYFKELPYDKLMYSNARLLCYIIKKGSSTRKVVIDYADGTGVISFFYKWADIYAKININTHETKVQDSSKLRLIAPGFGIRYYNFPQTLWHAFANCIKAKLGGG